MRTQLLSQQYLAVPHDFRVSSLSLTRLTQTRPAVTAYITDTSISEDTTCLMWCHRPMCSTTCRCHIAQLHLTRQIRNMLSNMLSNVLSNMLSNIINLIINLLQHWLFIEQSDHLSVTGLYCSMTDDESSGATSPPSPIYGYATY